MIKKLFLATIMILFLTTYSFGATALYRIASNEVLAIDINDGNFAGQVNDFLQVKTGATFPDGTECRDSNHSTRVLGIAKILDGDVVRNATQPEIDTFRPAHVNDLLQKDANAAIEYLNTDKKVRRIIIALSATFIQYEFNQYRERFRIMDEQVALATSLANLKTRWAALAAAYPMPDRNLSQLRQQIEDRISPDD